MNAEDIERLRPAAQKCFDRADELRAQIVDFAARLEVAISVQAGESKTLRAFALEAGAFAHSVQGLRMAIVTVLDELDKAQPMPGAPVVGAKPSKVGHT